MLYTVELKHVANNYNILKWKVHIRDVIVIWFQGTPFNRYSLIRQFLSFGTNFSYIDVISSKNIHFCFLFSFNFIFHMCSFYP